MIKESNEWKKSQELQAMLKLLALGEKEVEAGNVVDFDTALNTIEAMIAEHDMQQKQDLPGDTHGS